jgi:DNA topoisomerase I
VNHQAESIEQYSDANRAAAKSAGLRYVSDARPGIMRLGDKDSGFRYIDPDGELVADPATLARIRKLALPPAYTDVWICPLANGHLQATGRDARGRKQYRYHERWRSVRDETKYDRMLAFGDALPGLRERVESDLARRDMSRERVLATVVRLLETTRIRIGNEEYAATNHHYGLTTLRNRHVRVEGDRIRFSFVGKSGVTHRLELTSRKLARIVQKCRDLPGQELFEYIDGETGQIHAVHSHDVNDYLHAITGEPFTAKDFRTWAGTVLCAMELAALEDASSATAAKRNIAAAIKAVSTHLGNTPAVCRKCYVHPAILDGYTAGQLREALGAPRASGPLPPEEQAVLSFLRERSATAPLSPKAPRRSKSARRERPEVARSRGRAESHNHGG